MVHRIQEQKNMNKSKVKKEKRKAPHFIDQS